MRISVAICFCLVLFGQKSLGQTKQELLIQLEAKQKSIDSLKWIADNSENVIENRDRTIQMFSEGKVKLEGEKSELIKLLLQRDAEIARLKKQTQTGTSKTITLNNTRSGWKVPAGKYWIIHHVMTDYTAGVYLDSAKHLVVEGVHVFLKELNGVGIHDTTTGNLGPKIYCSLHPEETMKLPIVLTENNSLAISVMRDQLGKLVLHSGNVVFSITEKEL